MGSDAQKQNDEMMLSIIRDILLREDRDDIADIKELLDDPDKLSERIAPVIEFHIETLKRKFPKEYRKEVDKIVERKLKASQDELLDVVYPVMGKMVRKYVSHQFVSLKESLDDRLRNFFSTQRLVNRFKSMVFGVNEGDLLLSEMDSTSIEEVFLIERDSGVLLGHYSRNTTMDRDVVAGMLTAIKAFVEDAFSKERQDLEMIEYGTYKIYIQSFHLYYAAVILNGSVTATEKDRIAARLLDFAEGEMKGFSYNAEETDTNKLSSKLAEYFKHEGI